MLILRRYAYRGAELVVIPQPDGSIACIPEWMVEQPAGHFKLSAEPRFPLETLRPQARAARAASPSTGMGRPAQGAA